MKHSKFYFTCFTTLLLVCMLSLFFPRNENLVQEAFSKNEIVYGSYGQDVYELQGRLASIGFYRGDIDGDFGYQTLLALKRFQNEFGMKVDGIAGSSVKQKLWETTKNWKPTGTYSADKQKVTSSGDVNLTTTNRSGLSSEDLKLMANAVYGEARGEPYEGQVAVAAVILNRIESNSFPNTISGVIFQPGAFTAVSDGQIWLEPNESAMKAVRDAIHGWDPSDGCIYYFNPVTATSKWIWSRAQIKQIGKHIFCI